MHNGSVHTDVIIIGAGPTGLTLACDLARRDLSFRIFDKAAEPFAGSRGKGVQPRTLEVFEDLGIVQELLSAGSAYPRMNAHLWFLELKWHMVKQVHATPDVPYPTTWLVPQWQTEKILRDRLERLGRRVEQGVEIVGLEQDQAGASVQLRHEEQVQWAAASYIVAADGGRSFVRKSLGMEFAGSGSDEGRVIVGDLHVDGLSRNYWHVWPAAKGGAIGLCPLPHSDLFQLMMQLRASEDEPVLSEQVIQSRWLAATGLKNIRLRDPAWLSLFKPNVRMVDRYRVGRVFLAGDAALNVYRASDGTWFVLIVTPDKLAAVANAIGRADLLTDPRFADPVSLLRNMPQLASILDELFGSQPMTHWYEVFSGVHVTFGAVRGPEEVISDPQLRLNDIVVPLQGAGGTLTSTISSPIQVHGVNKVPAKRAPALGEHNEEVLKQLGFSATEIEVLRASGNSPKAKLGPALKSGNQDKGTSSG